ncbi:hypothetical protein MRX96_054609 [Rhipicephalus microplus]
MMKEEKKGPCFRGVIAGSVAQGPPHFAKLGKCKLSKLLRESGKHRKLPEFPVALADWVWRVWDEDWGKTVELGKRLVPMGCREYGERKKWLCEKGLLIVMTAEENDADAPILLFPTASPGERKGRNN